MTETVKRMSVKLLKARKKLGLSQRELSERTGIVQSQICSIEQGKTSPTWRSLLLLCDALGIKPNDLQ